MDETANIELNPRTRLSAERVAGRALRLGVEVVEDVAGDAGDAVRVHQHLVGVDPLDLLVGDVVGDLDRVRGTTP